ncbi:MAG: AAA family ATPase [Desulfobacterales bacterium]
MKPLDRLASYIEALRPVIYIHHFDFAVVDQLIAEAAGNAKIYEFNHGSGYVNFHSKCKEQPYSLPEFLDLFDDNDRQHCFLVLKDIHHDLDLTNIAAKIKSIALRTIDREEYDVTVFIVCTKLNIPRELEKLITIFDIPFPESEDILHIIDEYAKNLEIRISDDVKYDLAASFKGLSRFEIRQILNLAYQQSGTVDRDDAELILREKEQIIKKSGMLEIVRFTETTDDIGGLENLKQYLENKARIFKHLGRARRFGVDPPKGILIAGMPGCGKSLTSKATAQLFNVPLLRLDVGKLLGKYVGESEQNLRQAIRTAEAVSPCVLWIDELEKAFAGIGGKDGGNSVTTRLFGYFLTWLQEKESAVYVVATSNDISVLPPEFMRKGRFDELFYADFPGPEERCKIFEIHLRKRKKLSKAVNTIRLLKKTEGFSGADIEAVVKEAIERAFIDNEKEVDTDLLLQTIENTKSLSVTLKDKIADMKKALEKFDMKSASREQSEKP